VRMCAHTDLVSLHTVRMCAHTYLVPLHTVRMCIRANNSAE